MKWWGNNIWEEWGGLEWKDRRESARGGTRFARTALMHRWVLCTEKGKLAMRLAERSEIRAENKGQL